MLDWLKAKQAADGPAIRDGLSGYEGVLAIGTEAAEWWADAGPFAEAHTAGGGFTAAIEHVEAHAHGSVAWAAARATVATDDPGGMAVRLTLVLVREDGGRWRVVHSHASVPD